MPLQNRVTPFGELIATPARGTLMGNRGCLHGDARRIRQRFVGTRWIVCRVEFRDRHRTVMTPGRYTELFFLDEATALAAGHRPCAECQHDRYRAFLAHWLAGAGRASPPAADALDAALHTDRLDRRQQQRTHRERLARLPRGTMIAAFGHAYLVDVSRVRRWTPAGYAEGVALTPDAVVDVLTPRSVVRVLASGFPVGVHPTAS